MAQAVPNQMFHILEQLIHRLENILVGEGATGGGQVIPQDKHGRTEKEARKDYVDFCKLRPQFERGRGQWTDFAIQFSKIRNDFRIDDNQAKWALYMAIKGQASRLVVASMNPDNDPYNDMTYAQYLRRMGEKFSPAAESMQMESEYKARKQGKMEDVQNYINAKYELFQLARQNALPRDTAEFY